MTTLISLEDLESINTVASLLSEFDIPSIGQCETRVTYDNPNGQTVSVLRDCTGEVFLEVQ